MSKPLDYVQTLHEMCGSLGELIEMNEHYLMTWEDAGLISITDTAELELRLQRRQHEALSFALQQLATVAA